MVSQIDLLNGRVRVDAADLLSHGRAESRDVVILSGTLLEGIGNLYSDLDLYIIGHELPPKGPDSLSMQVVREDGRVRRVNEILEDTANIVLDVQYYTFRELATLARSLDELYAESRRNSRIFRKALHPDDEDLIHKLLTGTVLQDPTGRFNARESFNAGKFCFLKYRNEVCGYAEFRDLVGSWTDGDLDSCLYNIRSYLISQVSGAMFLAGNTNPRPKWFVRRLASLGEEYTELRERIMSWMHTARHTDLQKREAVETACDLIDMTYVFARELLGMNPLYYSAEEALKLTERDFAEHATHDREMAEEFQLLRRMFSSTVPPLFAQIDNQPRLRAPGVAA
jgi:hypothetical protein